MPFRFEIDMVSQDPELAVGQVIGQAATLELVRNDESRKIHGIVDEIRQGPPTEDGRYIYHARLVPRLERLAYSRQSQIHGTTKEVSVVDVIRSELTANALKGSKAGVAGRMSDADFDIRVSSSYPTRDYVVQYGETDLNFISRQAEAAGIFYFFDHSSGRDVVVFGDSRTAFNRMSDDESLRYRRTSGLVQVDEPSVQEFYSTTRPMPKKVVLRDYNYRLPHVSMVAEAVVDPTGHGVIVEYGDHFRTPNEGSRLAEIRAQEIRCHSHVYSGASDCIHLSAGHLFALEDHFRSDFNRGYCVIRVSHDLTKALPGISDIDGRPLETAYRNEFECIERTTEYRPRRRTPKPVMAGLSNAVVDAEGQGSRAELDDQGRYKIRQAFDLRDEADGKASQYMRKAEPYGGSNSGMHFPLLKNTEVVLSCVNGDPDRPIIMGAVPNPRNKSLVTSRNQTSNMLKSSYGNVIGIDDGNPTSSGGSGAGSGATLAPQRALEGGPAAPAGTDARRAKRRAARSEPVSQAMESGDLIRPASESLDAGTSNESRIYLKVTGTDSTDATDDHYVRLGTLNTSDSSDEDTYVNGTYSAAQYDGILMYTSGKLAHVAKSDSTSDISGNSTTTISGYRSVEIGEDSIEAGTMSDHLVVYGDQTATISGDVVQSFGGDQTVSVGGSFTGSYTDSHTTTYHDSKTATYKDSVSNTYNDSVTNTWKGEKTSLYYFPAADYGIFLGASRYVVQIGSSNYKFGFFGSNIVLDIWYKTINIKISSPTFNLNIGASLNQFNLYLGSRITIAAQAEITAKSMSVGAKSMLVSAATLGVGAKSVKVQDDTLVAAPTGFALEVYEFMKMQV